MLSMAILIFSAAALVRFCHWALGSGGPFGSPAQTSPWRAPTFILWLPYMANSASALNRRLPGCPRLSAIIVLSVERSV